MLTNISWSNYLVLIASLSLSWYVFVGLGFYLQDIKEFFSGKRAFHLLGTKKSITLNALQEAVFSEPIEEDSNTSELEVIDPVILEVDQLVDEIKTAVNDAQEKRLVKEEFLQYLQLILKEYPSIKNSPFRSSISELIVSECDVLDFVELTQEQAEKLWQDKL